MTTGVDAVQDAALEEAARGFAAQRRRVDEALRAFCDRHLGPLEPVVADAIRYSLLGEGKRLRPILVLAAYEAAGGAGDGAELAAAVEVVHAYSLVHDDLPCMDDDDMRRGRPTVHRVYGVAAATAAGLAMVPLAARCALDASVALGLPDDACGAIVRELMQASGAGGMIGGQQLDLEGEGEALSLERLERIHRAKTGALILAAAVLGGIAAGAGEDRLEALRRYGSSVGLAFQIADDVLDVTATTDQLGKTAGRDLALQKSTYPALLGVDGAMRRAEALIDDACGALAAVGLLTPALEYLARFTVARRS
ncbi:polyprenyl synthetase family protein [Roseisolibacter agri]|uniref:(2E,6E)-farnesyl diphosphate synthase n=1 Tax=Roseisolibacter agri TaxID=2014610 RepID=A0AA37V840_9BACT|nr:farnesyl diphosphate synthase [Roseisolibacter agri]GLC27416.1 (2E,6E)-farnesyl diphosphate synthase [Roseisolibacter agri]